MWGRHSGVENGLKWPEAWRPCPWRPEPTWSHSDKPAPVGGARKQNYCSTCPGIWGAQGFAHGSRPAPTPRGPRRGGAYPGPAQLTLPLSQLPPPLPTGLVFPGVLDALCASFQALLHKQAPRPWDHAKGPGLIHTTSSEPSEHGMENSSNIYEQRTRKPEQSRNVCLGLINEGQYEHFHLGNTADCFTKCTGSGNEPCDLENLQRYWLKFEYHLLESQSGIVNMSFLKAAVQNVSTSISEDLFFSLTPSQVPGQVTEDEQEHPDRVRLPRSLFESLKGNRSEVLLAITILDIGPGNLFKGPQLSLEDGSRVLNNRLVGLSLGRIPVSSLAEPLEITFSHQQLPPDMALSCVFWDASKGSTGDWSSTGCSTELRAKRTVCRCDHLTFFALLLKPILDQATVQSLIRISQAGCGASMIFLAFTIVLYAALRFSRQRFKSEDAPKIHVALSVSLFLLNLVFFVNVGHGREPSGATCPAQAAVFHYFLLCTFTWMGLEAFHLYLLVVKVFNTYFGHYFLKLSLVGWGLPALIVFGTGSADSYGRYVIRDKRNASTLELCWFQEKTAITALYITVHGYFLVTSLFSAVVLGLVAWKIFTLPRVTAGKEQGLNWKGVLTVLGLSSLVGVTWWLAILTPLGRPTIYVFAVCNSLQGVFIFCWFATLYFPSRSAVSSSSGTARADQVHTTSHD